MGDAHVIGPVVGAGAAVHRPLRHGDQDHPIANEVISGCTDDITGITCTVVHGIIPRPF